MPNKAQHSSQEEMYAGLKAHAGTAARAPQEQCLLQRPDVLNAVLEGPEVCLTFLCCADATVSCFEWREVMTTRPDAPAPQIDILIATYNGSQHILQQLESIEKQVTRFTFRVIVADDGSKDDTREKIEAYWREIGKEGVNILYPNTGNNRGIIRNFEFLIEQSQAPYLMFSDQDDVWLPDKVEVSVGKVVELEQRHVGQPVLVHTDRYVVDQNLEILNPSMLSELNATEDLSLHEGLLANVAAGCTMAFNRQLAELSLPFPPVTYMHDWWLFLVAKCYGVSCCLKESTLLYRQHGNNTLGTDAKSRSVAAILRRTKLFFARGSMNELYRVCFAQAGSLYELGIKNNSTELKNMKTVQKFIEGRDYKNWKLKLHVFRFRYLPRGYISKLAVLVNLK